MKSATNYSGKTRWNGHGAASSPLVGDALAPLIEGPIPESEYELLDEAKHHEGSSSWWVNMRSWMKAHGKKRSDPRILLGVLGCPLSPVPETSSAQYIVRQYMAATGVSRLQGSSIHNSYAAGKVRMATTEHESTKKTVKKKPARSVEKGWFVLWQMMPDQWYMELALENCTIQAGCDGKLVWRHAPWLGAHPAKGPIRPLRRALQGLDPAAIARLFIGARCIGERRIEEEDCFVLKVAADQPTLSSRRSGAAEVVSHVLFGYFSHKTGLLVRLEDTHLTRIQPPGSDPVFWETVIESSLKDYEAVDSGLTLAHSGRSLVTLLGFGPDVSSRTKIKMEESWRIDEVAFNVPGLAPEFFIPPSDVFLDSSPSPSSIKEVSSCSPLPHHYTDDDDDDGGDDGADDDDDDDHSDDDDDGGADANEKAFMGKML